MTVTRTRRSSPAASIPGFPGYTISFSGHEVFRDGIRLKSAEGYWMEHPDEPEVSEYMDTGLLHEQAWGKSTIGGAAIRRDGTVYSEGLALPVTTKPAGSFKVPQRAAVIGGAYHLISDLLRAAYGSDHN